MAVVKGLMAVSADNTGEILWGGLSDGDVGEAVNALRFPAKTIEVSGTFSTSCSVTMQGSAQSADDGDWYTLTDDFGNDLSLTAADVKNIRQNPKFIRPSVSSAAGSTTSCLTVHIAAV